MQLQSFLLVLLPLVSAVDFNCHPAFEQSLQGTSCPISRVSVAGDVNRASCGTAGVIDFSPGSGNKNGRIKIQNLGSRPANYYYMYAKDGERTYYRKWMKGNDECDWELPPHTRIGQVSFVLH